MKFNLKSKSEFIKLIKFALVGGMNTVIDWTVYFVLTTWCGASVALGNVVGYSCGIVSSYLGNKFFTFKSKTRTTFAETAKFLIVNLLSLGASTLVAMLCADVFGWDKMLAKIPATAAAMTINYIGSRFFVFEKRTDKHERN